MEREKLSRIFGELESKARNTKAAAQWRKDEAQQMSAVVASSPSASGDRRHSVCQAKTSEGVAERMQALRSEIQKELNEFRESPKSVRSVCSVSVQFSGEKESFTFCLVKNPTALLPGVNFIAPGSNFTKALQGKRAGDEFSFYSEVERKRVSGKIINIE